MSTDTDTDDPIKAGWWAFACDECIGPKLYEVESADTFADQMNEAGPHCTGCGGRMEECMTPKEHIQPDADAMGRLHEEYETKPLFSPYMDGICEKYDVPVGAFGVIFYRNGINTWEVEVYGKASEAGTHQTGGMHDKLGDAIRSANTAIRELIDETLEVIS